MNDLDQLAAAAWNSVRSGARTMALDPAPVYMVFDRGKEWGPFSQAEVWLYAGEGRFNDTAQARHLSHPGWFTLGALLPPGELEPEPAPVAYSGHRRQAYRPGMHTNRIAAGVVALLLPAGIHKLLMGFIGTGILQLALTLATCGIAGVIAFIEGIIYLTKSEEQFFYDYHVNKRTWF